MRKLLRAIEFATVAHKEQKRKYTGEPYILHPIRVAMKVAEVSTNEDALAAAVLHDTVEDTYVTSAMITKEFGIEVANMVDWLTDVSTPAHGNRAARKLVDRMFIANAPIIVKTIKLADLIDNSDSIVKHDESFSKVYMEEKRRLLTVLKAGNETLFKEATNIVEDYYRDTSRES